MIFPASGGGAPLLRRAAALAGTHLADRSTELSDTKAS